MTPLEKKIEEALDLIVVTQVGGEAFAITETVDLAKAQLEALIQEQIRLARIDELNKHIAWADENVGGITLSRQQLDDRLTKLKAGDE